MIAGIARRGSIWAARRAATRGGSLHPLGGGDRGDLRDRASVASAYLPPWLVDFVSCFVLFVIFVVGHPLIKCVGS